MRVLAYGMLAAWMLSATVGGAAPPQGSSQDLAIGASASRELEDKGFDHFYNLEYDSAIAAFQKLRDSDPDNPSWRNDLAVSYFYREILNAGVMEGDLFAGSNRYFRTRRIPPDAAFEKNFHDANKAAIDLCEGRLKKNPKDRESLYACGVAYADSATYLGLRLHHRRRATCP